MPRAKQKRIIAVDSETDPFKRGRVPSPFVWGGFDGVDYVEFWNTDEFIKWLKDQDAIVYAHNGGKFDWFFVLHEINKNDNIHIINGRFAKFKIGRAECRDSLNIIPVGLGKFKKDDFDYTLCEPAERVKPENRVRISRYLESDCRNLHELVSAYIERYGISLTQAGSAMRVWSKMSGTKPPKTSESYYDDVKPYYFGGRTECFEKGIFDGPITAYDIKSAYPAAMMHEHAWGTTTEIHTDGERVKERPGACLVEIEGQSLGSLPLRGEGLSFPHARAKFACSGWEAVEAMRRGDMKIVKVTEYAQTINFTQYVERFYADKLAAEKAGDRAGVIFAKLFLNSLYGKFAADPRKYENFVLCRTPEVRYWLERGMNYCGQLAKDTAVMSQPLPEAQRRFYNVATAASITGYVRAQMWRTLQKVRRPLYCDTDSVIFKGNLSDNPDAFDIGDRLGQWSDDGYFVRAAFAGKKLYALKRADGSYKTASKGVRLTGEEIFRIAGGEEILHERDVPTFSAKRGVSFVDRIIRMT